MEFKKYEHNFIKGKCETMCPFSEIIMREKEGLLHLLEIKSDTIQQKRPRADHSRIIKAYSRSAAGRNMAKPEDLRPPDILLQTLNYLLHDVITTEGIEFWKLYEFVADRILAIRQDMIIQNINKEFTVSILQPIVRFYAYSAYRLCEEPIACFDPSINDKQLQECLKRLLTIYDDFDTEEDRIGLSSNSKIDLSVRPYFESMYLLLNLGDPIAINRGLNLLPKWRTPLVNECLKISMYYLKGNWVRVCRDIIHLPALLLCVASLHLPSIRRKALHTMNVAYSNKILKFPTNILRKLLLYNREDDLLTDCRYYNVGCDEKCVYFEKGKFNLQNKVISPKHVYFVDVKISKKTVPDLLLD